MRTMPTVAMEILQYPVDTINPHAFSYYVARSPHHSMEYGGVRHHPITIYPLAKCTVIPLAATCARNQHREATQATNDPSCARNILVSNA